MTQRIERRLAGAAHGISFVILFGILLAGCGGGFNDADLEVGRICSMADTAFSEQEFGDLPAALEKEFGVPGEKMRVGEKGVFIPVKERFVEEEGYFVAKPGVDPGERGDDPAFRRVRGCLYRYRIKG